MRSTSLGICNLRYFHSVAGISRFVTLSLIIYLFFMMQIGHSKNFLEMQNMLKFFDSMK